MFGKGGNGQDVVSMTERERMRRLAPLRQVEAYWHGLCAADAVPLRSQVDPRGMQDVLENAFLMERIAPTMAKIRVAGTHLNDLMGMQVAGMPLSSLIAPPDRDRFGGAVAKLFADPAIVRVELRGEDGFGKPELDAHMLLLPLRSDFGDQTRALGALVSHGRIGRTPRRFTVGSIEVTPALSGKSVVAVDAPAPEERAPRLEMRQDLGSDSPLPAAAPSEPPEGSAAPHLRLVVSND